MPTDEGTGDTAEPTRKRRRGGAPQPESARARKVLSLRFTSEERRALETLAARAGLSVNRLVSSWLAKACAAEGLTAG